MRPSNPQKQLVEITSLSAIDHILRHRPQKIQGLVLAQNAGSRVHALESLAREAGISVRYANRANMREGEPASAVLKPFEYETVDELLKKMSGRVSSVVLALDHLQDPQNFGAICRTAEGMGLQGILLPRDRSVVVSPGVYHASVGAVETIPIAQVVNLAAALARFKEEGFWVVAAGLGEKASKPKDVPDFDKLVLVLGAELSGLSSGIEKLCDWKVRIPLRGHIESLNVSVAAGILMYELTNRQAAAGK